MKNIKLIRVTDIDWDLDDEDKDVSLPDEVLIRKPSVEMIDSLDDPYSEMITDYLSDQYGFCVRGYHEEVEDDPAYLLEGHVIARRAPRTRAAIQTAKKDAKKLGFRLDVLADVIDDRHWNGEFYNGPIAMFTRLSDNWKIVIEAKGNVVIHAETEGGRRIDYEFFDGITPAPELAKILDDDGLWRLFEREAVEHSNGFTISIFTPDGAYVDPKDYLYDEAECCTVTGVISVDGLNEFMEFLENLHGYLHIDLSTRLMEKLDDDLDHAKRRVLDMDKEEILAFGAEIYFVKCEIYNFFFTKEVSTDLCRGILKIPNPLEAMYDEWYAEHGSERPNVVDRDFIEKAADNIIQAYAEEMERSNH